MQIKSTKLMTALSSLSPSAQNLLNACNEAVERLPFTAEPMEFSLAMIAAAIRAAAGLEVSSSFDGTLYETGEDEFRAFLHYIAAELEGAS